MKVISLLNQKGGSGKTTISINVCARLTELGHRVMLIDADFTQESAMTWAAINEGKYFEVVVMQASQLEAFIRRNQETYDYIVIDCPPRANADAGKFVQASDVVLIPVQPSPYDIWACTDLLDLIHTRKDATKGVPGLPPNGTPHAAFVLSMATKRTTLIGDTMDALSDTGLPVLDSMTTQHNVYKRAPMTGLTIFDAEKRSPDAEEQIIGITDEVLEAIK